MTIDLNRRALLGTATAALSMSGVTVSMAADAKADPLAVPDDGWSLWLDRDAKWQDDTIYLPADVPAMGKLPVNPPTGGWDALFKGQGQQNLTTGVTLPATVEQFYWGQFQKRPYGVNEYKYSADDPIPQNGAYVGISWWWRSVDIPASAQGQQVWLRLRGARLRAEVFLNEQLVGYSIMSELPILCDLTKAMKPGQPNRLAIRITNPGGGYDWKDAATVDWGGVKFYPGHGFGGLDRGMTLSVHPASLHIREAYVLNRPEDRTVDGYVEVAAAKLPANAKSLKSSLSAQLVDSSGNAVKADVTIGEVTVKDGVIFAQARVHAPDSKIWDLDTPNLYFLRLTWTDGKVSDTATVRFGFRWYTIDGIGKNAMLRLNGRRIKLYSSISWGFWGYNALWPTPELARREVTAAKALGLNSLSFHRNMARPEVLDRQDEMGLTRTMEPGSGKQAIGKMLKPGQTLSVAEKFARDYMLARCEIMVKTFRSHPSVLQYTVQNEIGADLANPDVEILLMAMHAADPSRTVILNDGFVARGAAQAMLIPYSDHYYRSDVEKWGGWWVQHQSAGDQWYDKFYVDKDNMVHHETTPEAIIEFGEMEGCAVCDNHVKMIADIMQHGGKSYDLQDHMDIVAGYNTFLDKWGFRQAFPKTENLFLSIGEKQYASWQEYMENIRIGDQVDMGAISGWESTAIENHSGIVDNLRYFHSDPDLIRSSLLPVRPVAKQRKKTYELGEAAWLDIWLLNDTAQPVTGQLTLSIVDPDGKATQVGTYAAPANVADQYSYLLAEKVATPTFTKAGLYKVRLELSGKPESTFVRDLWAVDTTVKPWKKKPKIALSGIANSLRTMLGTLSGVTFEDFRPGQSYDGIIASGLKADEIAKRQVGDVTGNESPSKTAKPVLVAGELSLEVLDAVKKGLPLLAIVPDDGLADGVAKQLSNLGFFTYGGQVGDLRAPWMGNWNILRKHALFDGIPSDTAAGLLHQIPGQPSNGLLVNGDGVEIIAAYSRDHDRKLGAATLISRKGGMRIVVHRMPDMVEPLQKRFLLNAIGWLAQV